MTGPLELAEKVSRFEDDLDASITSGLADGMGETKSDTERNIEANDSDVSGALKDSVSLDRDAPLDAHHAMQVIIDAEYAPYVEYGTGSFNTASDPLKQFKAPDDPPYGRIRQWIIRKGITADNPELQSSNLVQDETFVDSEGNETTIYAEQKQLAWAIMSSIEAFGNRPHPFARPAARSGFDATTDAVSNEMKAALRRF